MIIQESDYTTQGMAGDMSRSYVLYESCVEYRNVWVLLIESMWNEGEVTTTYLRKLCC